MSLSGEMIKYLAQLEGIPELNDECANVLAKDVEYRLRELIQEGIKFMKHGKRFKLSSEDINNSLKLRNMDILFGYSSSKPVEYIRVRKDLVSIKETELDVEQIINAPLPKYPRDVSINTHWLAIEGVQPSIPQNPSNKVSDLQTTPSSKSKKKKVGNLLAKIKPLVHNVLSKELQQYYEKITNTIRGNDLDLIRTAFTAIRSDSGISQLLPYFIQFITDEVTNNLHQLDYLQILMKMMHSLMDNPHFFLETYIHQLIPPILTCLIGKKLCLDPKENHWQLRDYSSNLLSLLCKKYGKTYSNLIPRIQKSLIQAFLDPSKPLGSHYGAIVGLTGLGVNSIRLFLLPNLSLYMKVLQPKLISKEPQDREDSVKCFTAIKDAAGMYLFERTKTITETDSMEEDGVQSPSSSVDQEEDGMAVATKLLPDENNYYTEIYQIFGEKILPYVANQEDFLKMVETEKKEEEFFQQ